ncbi:hypothetical protein [Duganella sp. S19_KUP01_CR8]|uniref:hypothetical protein n=1 Tax=Duganella sp. S19_KUP01_CR8 TaxID=3025502 RepID=UPI002FCDACB2
MNIAALESFKELMAKVRESEASLPSAPVVGELPPLAGLSAFETEMMFVRLLEQVGMRLDVELDCLDGVPTRDELLSKITNAEVASMLREEFRRLGLTGGVSES